MSLTSFHTQANLIVRMLVYKDVYMYKSTFVAYFPSLEGKKTYEITVLCPMPFNFEPIDLVLQYLL